MKSVGKKKSFQTRVTKKDQAKLRRLITLLGPIAREAKALPPLGAYNRMSREDLWFELVVSVCVRGSARGIENLGANKPQFKRQLSVTKVMAQRKRRSYIERVLKSFKATRFPRKSAEMLARLLNSSLLKKKDLDGNHDVNDLREAIIEKSNRCFRLKTASNFMISVGLSRDLIALDSRIIGMLTKHFDYTLNGEAAEPAKIQGNKALYLSIENELRKVTKRTGESLALLDRVLFGFDRYSGRYVWRKIGAL